MCCDSIKKTFVLTSYCFLQCSEGAGQMSKNRYKIISSGLHISWSYPKKSVLLTLNLTNKVSRTAMKSTLSPNRTQFWSSLVPKHGFVKAYGWYWGKPPLIPNVQLQIKVIVQIYSSVTLSFPRTLVAHMWLGGDQTPGPKSIWTLVDVMTNVTIICDDKCYYYMWWQMLLLYVMTNVTIICDDKC